MRIAIVIEAWFPYVGGGQVYVRELSERLVRQYGCTVDIVTRALRLPDGAEARQSERDLGGRRRVIRLGAPRPVFSVSGRLAFLWQAVWYLLRHRYDILNPQSSLPGLPGRLAGRLRRTPVVFTVHGTALFLPWPRTWRGRVERAIERWLVLGLRYDAEVSVAWNLLTLPNRNRRRVVVPNGIDVRSFDAIDVPRAEPRTVLFVGRFDPIKGLVDLLAAVDQLHHQRRLSWTLELVGDGPERARLEASVRERGLAEVVRFRGPLFGRDLMRAYKRASLFVLASHSEGFPLTLLEAWAARLPVLATRVGDLPVLIEDGVTGFLVEPQRPGELAQALAAVLERPDLAAIGQRGYERARDDYTWERTAQLVYTLYTQVRAPVRAGAADHRAA